MNADPRAPQTVLIVEDHPDNRALASKVLRRAGFVTFEIDRAEGLIEAVTTNRPDLILMDIELPGQSGHDAVMQLKSNAMTAGIPVVAVTAYAMPEDREQCFRVGCCDYLSKPLDINLLVQTVRKHLPPRT